MKNSSDNIITKVVNHFRDKIPVGLDINIEKNIPIGAGMGGGSSNAAGMLIALNELFNLDLSTETLMTIGAKYGADIPFFIKGGKCLVTGYGEVVNPLQDTEACHYLIINPGIHISTKDIYSHFDSQSDIKEAPTEEYINQVKKTSLGPNDLKEPAFNLKPDLITIEKQLLEICNKPIYMTGSGSTLFIEISSIQEGEQFKEKITQVFPNYLVETVSSINTGSIQNV